MNAGVKFFIFRRSKPMIWIAWSHDLSSMDDDKLLRKKIKIIWIINSNCKCVIESKFKWRLKHYLIIDIKSRLMSGNEGGIELRKGSLSLSISISISLSPCRHPSISHSFCLCFACTLCLERERRGKASKLLVMGNPEG